PGPRGAFSRRGPSARACVLPHGSVRTKLGTDRTPCRQGAAGLYAARSRAHAARGSARVPRSCAGLSRSQRALLRARARRVRGDAGRRAGARRRGQAQWRILETRVTAGTRQLASLYASTGMVSVTSSLGAIRFTPVVIPKSERLSVALATAPHIAFLLNG